MSIQELVIKKVKVQNYRSLEDLEVQLNKGLNIIIGDNGAGKSNFLKFLGELFAEDYGELKYGKYSDEGLKGIDYSLDIEYKDRKDLILFQFSSISPKNRRSKDYQETHRIIRFSKYRNGSKVYEDLETPLTLVEDEKTLDKLKVENNILRDELLLEFIEFSIPQDILYVTSPGKLFLRSDKVEEDDSEVNPTPLFILFDFELEKWILNLSSSEKRKPEILKGLILKVFEKKKKEEKYIQLLRKYSPISDIKLNENINIYKLDKVTLIDNIILNFKIDGNWVPWSYLSDGTRRMFHIITEIVLGEGNIILIEEPELGVHPNQLFKLMDFLKEQAEKKQIIISTHSPIPLDVLSPDELDQIIIAKMTKQGTQMEHLTKQQKEKARAYIKEVGNLSAYWLHSDLEK